MSEPTSIASSPSPAALAAVQAIHAEKLARITSGQPFLTVEEEARIVENFWFDHRSQIERTLEHELHTANQQLARALSGHAGKSQA